MHAVTQNAALFNYFRRSLKILDPLEKTKMWAKETQAMLSRKNPLQESMHAESTVTTRMSSGYVSEEVNPSACANRNKGVTSGKFMQNNNINLYQKYSKLRTGVIWFLK